MIKIKKVLGKTRQYLLADGRIVSIADVKAGRIKDMEDKRSELKKIIKDDPAIFEDVPEKTIKKKRGRKKKKKYEY